MKTIYFFISLALLTISCSTAEKDFKSELSSGRCDEALTKLPDRDPMIKLTSETKQAAGTVASYAIVGASYGVQILWDVAGGTVGAIVLCGPTMIAAAAAGGNYGGPNNPDNQLRCLPGDYGKFLAPPLGKKALQKTRHMRCPDLKSFSESLRAVATCFETSGGQDNLSKAIKSLESVKNSKDFYSCLPNSERDNLERQMASVRGKLDREQLQ